MINLNKIKIEIENYYSTLGVVNYIDFSSKILLYCDEINGKNLEIYITLDMDASDFRVLVLYNNKEIRNIKFYTLDEMEFFFISKLSEEFFKNNIDFFTRYENKKGIISNQRKRENIYEIN